MTVFKEHLGSKRPPVNPDAFVLCLKFDRTTTARGWVRASFLDWEWIGCDTDIIGYKVAGPLRTLFLKWREAVSDS